MQRRESPDEIKKREVSWTLTRKLDAFASVDSQGRSYGHCLCDSVLHSSWDSNCGTVAAAQPWSSGLAPVSSLYFFPPSPNSSPSLIGLLLASVDVKQNYSGMQRADTARRSP